MDSSGLLSKTDHKTGRKPTRKPTLRPVENHMKTGVRDNPPYPLVLSPSEVGRRTEAKGRFVLNWAQIPTCNVYFKTAPMRLPLAAALRPSPCRARNCVFPADGPPLHELYVCSDLPGPHPSEPSGRRSSPPGRRRPFKARGLARTGSSPPGQVRASANYTSTTGPKPPLWPRRSDASSDARPSRSNSPRKLELIQRRSDADRSAVTLMLSYPPAKSEGTYRYG